MPHSYLPCREEANGTLFDVQLSGNLVTNDRGQPICMMASFVDITDRKLAEKALRESEHKLRSIIEGSPGGIVLCDEDGIIIEWNPAQERISGVPAVEVVRSLTTSSYASQLPSAPAKRGAGGRSGARLSSTWER